MARLGKDEGHRRGRDGANGEVDPKCLGKQAIRKDIGWCSASHLAPGLQHDQFIRIGGGEIEVVEDREDSGPVGGEVSCDVQNGDLMLEIEAGDGFVKKQHLARLVRSPSLQLA